MVGKHCLTPFFVFTRSRRSTRRLMPPSARTPPTPRRPLLPRLARSRGGPPRSLPWLKGKPRLRLQRPNSWLRLKIRRSKYIRLSLLKLINMQIYKPFDLPLLFLFCVLIIVEKLVRYLKQNFRDRVMGSITFVLAIKLDR